MSVLMDHDEWLEAFREATAPRPENAEGFASTEELAHLMGVSRATVGHILRALQEAGRMEHRRRQVKRINGTRGWLDTYRLKPAEEEADAP